MYKFMLTGLLHRVENTFTENEYIFVIFKKSFDIFMSFAYNNNHRVEIPI